METKQPGCCGSIDSQAFFDVDLSYCSKTAPTFHYGIPPLFLYEKLYLLIGFIRE